MKEKDPFQYLLSTRWRDLDAFGHVNNAAFLTYIEDARIQLLKHWHVNKQQSVIVAAIQIDYIQQLKHPETIIIDSKITRLGTTSFDLQSTILKQSDKPVARTTTTLVCYDYEIQQPIPIYPAIKDNFNNRP